MSDIRWEPSVERVDSDAGKIGDRRRRDTPVKSDTRLRTPGVDLGSWRGRLATNRDGPGDEDYVELGSHSESFLGGRGELDFENGKVEANIVDAQAKAAAVRAVLVPGSPVEFIPKVVSFTAPGPYAARLGDPTAHGPRLGPGIGSANVLIGGQPAFRVGLDFSACPQTTPTPHIGGVATGGAPTVLVNGFPLARAGDPIIEAAGGPNPIAMGCPTVLAGPPAPAVSLVEYEARMRDNSIRLLGDLIEIRASEPIVGELGTLDAGVKLGAAGDLKTQEANGRAKLQAILGGARGSGGGELIVHLPLIDKAFRVGGQGSVTLGCAGGELEIELAVDDGKTKFERGDPKLGVRPICTDASVDWGFIDDPEEQ